MTWTNTSEVQLGAEPRRRRELAEFMVRESDNLGLVDNPRIERIELGRAVHQLLSLERPPLPNPRESLLCRGLARAFGAGARDPSLDPVMNAAVRDIEAQPEMSVELCVEALSSETRATNYKLERRLRQRLEEIRTESVKLPEPARRELEVRNAFNLDLGAYRYEQQLRYLGVDMSALRTWLRCDGNPTLLALAVPHQRVFLDLFFYRDRNAGHPYKENDARDFEFLKLAIPYANIVILEKAWAHIGNQCGLGKAFGTTIAASLEKLPQILSDAGAI